MLFRHEVYEARKHRLHGEVILAGTSSSWGIIYLISSIILAISIAITTGSYARTETAIGYILPEGDITNISATRAGVITSIFYKEGALVKSGQPLAAIMVAQSSPTRADPTGENLLSIDRQRSLIETQIKIAQDSQQNEKYKSQSEISELIEQLKIIPLQIENQKKIVESARTSYEPLTQAAQEGYVSKIQFEAQRQQFLNAEIQLNHLYEQKAQLTSQLSQEKANYRELPGQTKNKISDLESNNNALLQKRIEIENSQSYVVTSPINGKIINTQASVGKFVTAAEQLMSLTEDNARMQAIIFAPSRAIGFAKVGEEVRLMYDAFPYERFGSFSGKITSISNVITSPMQVDDPVKGQIKEPVYRIEVELKNQTVNAFGKKISLQSGMTLKADIVLDRRNFIDWLLEPINAVRNRG